MSPPGHPVGWPEPLPVCGAWRADGVVRGGREGGASLLAAARGRGPPCCGDGCQRQMHAEHRVEMVMDPNILPTTYVATLYC